VTQKVCDDKFIHPREQMVVFLSIVVLFSLHVSNLGKMGVSCVFSS
jgi:hypothetical protein